MKARRKRIMMSGAALACLLFANGCVWAPELAAVKTDIAHQFPDVDFHKNVTLSFGPVTMVLARTVTSFIPDAREARPYLRDVSHLQVAVYEVEGAPGSEGVRTPAALQHLMDNGWEMAVRVRDEGELVWVLYRIEKESVREMFVVALSDDELVLVKVRGRLERIMAAALHDASSGEGFLHGPGGARL